MHNLVFFLIGGLLIGALAFGAISSNQNKTANSSNPVNSQALDPFEESTSNPNLQLKPYYPPGYSSSNPTGLACTKGKLAVEFLIDDSSSMSCANSKGDCKIQSLVKAVNEFIKNMDDTDVIGVHTFNQKNPVIALNLKKNVPNFESSIKKLENNLGVGTTMLNGFNKSKDAISTTKPNYPGYNWNLILVTDGCPGKKQIPISPVDVPSQIRTMGVSIYGVGIELGGAGKCDNESRSALGITDKSVNVGKYLLDKITADPNKVYEPSADKVSEIMKQLKSNICPTQSTASNPLCTPKSIPSINMLVDTSGSMDNSIPILREVLKNFGNKLNVQNIVGIQDFSDGEPPRIASARVKLNIGQFSQTQFNRAVDSLPADSENGLTAMKEGFAFAKDQIDDYITTSDYKDWLLIFLSDGIPETKSNRPDPNQNPTSIADDLKGKNMTIASIALGAKTDKDLMRSLASDNLYFEANTAADLEKVYTDLFLKISCQ